MSTDLNISTPTAPLDYNPAKIAPNGENLKWAKIARAGLMLTVLCIDLLLISFSAFLAANPTWSDRSLQLLILFTLQYVPIAIYLDCFGIERLKKAHEALLRNIGAVALAAMSLLVLAAASKTTANYSRIEFSLFIVISAVSLSLSRLALARLARATAPLTRTQTLLLEDGADAGDHPAANRLDISQMVPRLDEPVFLNDFSSLISGHERVVLACSDPARRSQWVSIFNVTGVSAEVIAPDLGFFAFGINSWNRKPTIVVTRGPLKWRERFIKRIFDFGGAVVLLGLLSPILLLVAIAIRVDSPGPVLFRQARVGLNNKQFKMIKFRSMRHEKTDHHGARSSSPEDDRITAVGRLLRRYSIDELPQLLNVLNGSMSLVGPRPHALGSRAGDRLFWEIDQAYWTRHITKPGITGLAQVRGFRGATDQESDLVGRLHSDLEYIECWSIWLDILILFRTFGVIRHHKAY